MYRFHATSRRIDWLYQQYAGTLPENAGEFVNLVNEVYYKHFASLYKERFVADIERQYQALFADLNLRERCEMTIVNVGGGAGFEFEQFLANGVPWREYLFIEPDAEMIRLFQQRHDLHGQRVRILQGRLEDFADELKQIPNKLIVFNSCLHHVIWLESVLDAIKEMVRGGDVVMLCHEPNNAYVWSPFMLLNYTLRSLTTDFLLRKLGLYRSRAETGRQSCWNNVNEELIARQITCQRLPPIAIRRMIDYGIGSKGDWRSVGVPREYDEGHWTPQDLASYLGADFRTVSLRMYRCLGDPGQWRLLNRLNRWFDSVFPQSGSVFCMAVHREP